MNLEHKFYVYEHIRPDTGAVFYVGKGCGNRSHTFTRRGKKWDAVVQKFGVPIVRLAVDGMVEELSWLAEIELIDALKRRGVVLVNVSAGGNGFGSIAKTPEHRAKIAASKIGKPRPIEMVERMKATKKGKLLGAENPFFGKHHSDKTKEVLRIKSGQKKHSEDVKLQIKQSVLKTYATHKKSKPVYCITNNTTYYSINEAARQLNLQRDCITLVCNKKMHHSGNYKFEWSTA
jgi:hypothetical protein